MLIHWNFDPVMISIGPLAIRWYGLLFVGAFLTGQTIIGRLFKAEGVDPKIAENLLLYALLGCVIGARLAHCFFYDPHYYLTHPLEILRIWKGGLASHGGAVGLLLGLWLGNRSLKPPLPFLWLVDRITIPAALGAVFVRGANFLNSEIIGMPTSGNWGVVFEAVDKQPRHPAQLYEAAAYLCIWLILTALYRRQREKTPYGLLAGWFLILVFTARIVVEFFKAPQAAYATEQIFRVGQYLSLPFVIVGIVMVLWTRKRPVPDTKPPRK